MKKPANELIAEVSNYDDSEELATALETIANESQSSPEIYYLIECASHIRGMYCLLQDLSRALDRAEKGKNVTTP